MKADVARNDAKCFVTPAKAGVQAPLASSKTVLDSGLAPE
jgi:hypothetical protein